MIDRIRGRLLKVEHRPYVRLGWHSSPEAAVRTADALIATGHRPAGGGDPIPVAVPFPWDLAGEVGATLELIEPLLEADAVTGDASYVKRAVDLALDFDRRGETVDPPGVAGARAYRLAGLIGAAAPVASDDELTALIATAERHVAALAKDSGGVWRSRTLGSAGLLALTERLGGVLPRARRLQRTARRRLGRQLGALEREGIVPEMSPRDLADAAEIVAALDASGLIECGGLRSAVEDALAWFLLPDGALVTLQGTADETLTGGWGGRAGGPGALTDRFASKPLIHVLSEGVWGASPGVARAFPEAGYAVLRDDGGAHVAMSGEDGLAVTWFDRGRRLLVGPGSGVDDSAEKTPIDELTADRAAIRASLSAPGARNTVEIGPSGGVGRGVSIGASTDGLPRMTAEADRGPAHHRRTVTLAAGEWVLIADELAADVEVRYRRWLHFMGDLDVVPREWGLLVADQGEPFAWVVDVGGGIMLTPQRARPGKAPVGWWSPRPGSLGPRWSIGWEQRSRAASMGVVVSLLGRPEAHRSSEGIEWRIGGRRVAMAAGVTA